VFDSQSQVKLEDRIKSLNEIKVNRQRLIAKYDEEIRDGEQWQACLRDLHHFLSTLRNPASKAFVDLVRRELALPDHASNLNNNSNSKNKDAKDVVLQRLARAIVAPHQAIVYTDVEALQSTLQAHSITCPSMRELLVAWIDQCKSVEVGLQQLMVKAQELLLSSSSSPPARDVSSLELIKSQLEMQLASSPAVHLGGELLSKGREWVNKLDDALDDQRLQQEMASMASSTVRQFPYIARAQSLLNNVRNNRQANLESILSSAQQQSQWTMLQHRLVDLLQKVTATRMPLFELARLVNAWGCFLQDLFNQDKGIFAAATIRSLEVWIGHYSQSRQVQDACLVSTLIFGCYRLLTASPRELFVKTLKGLLYSSSLLIPSFIQAEKHLEPNVKQQSDMALLLGTLVGYSSDNSDGMQGPLDAGFGWTFLMHSVEQLHFIVTNQQAMISNKGDKTIGLVIDTISIDTACLVLFQFLQTAGYALFTSFHTHFEQLLCGLQDILRTDVARSLQTSKALQEFIRKALTTHLISPVFFNDQDPSVVDMTLLGM
jgi:hypothetical protein